MRPKGAKDKKPRRKGYWIEFFEAECVLCWRGYVDRVRVYDRPKPENYGERHHFDQHACEHHF